MRDHLCEMNAVQSSERFPHVLGTAQGIIRLQLPRAMTGLLARSAKGGSSLGRIGAAKKEAEAAAAAKAKAAPKPTPTPAPAAATLSDGLYKVGADIPAGSYRPPAVAEAPATTPG